MTKCDYTLYSYKRDLRFRAGERAVMTRVMTDMTGDDMAILAKSLAQPGYRYEYFSADLPSN